MGCPMRETRWSLVQLIAGVAVVSGLGFLLALLLTRDFTPARQPVSAFSPMLSDSFDRPSSDEGLGTTSDGTWIDVSGGWGVDAGIAILRRPAEDRDSIATIGVTVPQVSVSLRVAGLSQCGVIVRYQDPLNYLSMIRVHAFGVWNIYEVVDGNELLLAEVPDENSNDVRVTLTATDHVVAASVGFASVTVVHDPALEGTKVGLVARGEGAGQCSWDDLNVQRAN
jgi:hypothetical protein